MNPWDELPSVGSWLCAGKNSSHSKVKAGLFREIHIALTECSPSQEVRAALEETYLTDRVWALKYGVVSFMGWVISRLMSGRIIPTILGEGWRFPGIGSPAHFLVFYG